MSKDVVEWMQALFLPAVQACRAAHWSPAVDVYRTRSGWLVKLELAGVRPGDLSVGVRGSHLTVRGKRLDACAQAGLTLQGQGVRTRLGHSLHPRWPKAAATVAQLARDAPDAAVDRLGQGWPAGT